MTYYKAENGATYWSDSNGFAYKFTGTREEIQQYLSDLVKNDLGRDDITVSISANVDEHSVMYGSPYSTATILASMGCCYIDVPEGFEMDSTKYGKMFKIRVNEDSSLLLEGDWIGSYATVSLNALNDTNLGKY